jgi:hypothetical protein
MADITQGSGSFAIKFHDNGDGTYSSYSTITPGHSYLVNNLKGLATVTTKASELFAYSLINLNATPAYLQVFDTTATVTLGTTVPSAVIPIPSNATAANGSGANMSELDGAIASGTIQIAATTAATGNTAVTTGLYGTVWWK